MAQPWVAGSANVARVGYGLGLALSSIGIAGTLWAQLAMGNSWRIGVDHQARTELVSEGH